MVKITEGKTGHFRGGVITGNLIERFQYRGGIVILFVFINLNARRFEAFNLMFTGHGDVSEELQSIGCASGGEVGHCDSGGMMAMDFCWVWWEFG